MMGRREGCSLLRGAFLAALLVVLAGRDCSAFYLPGLAPVTFCTKETEERHKSSDSPLDGECQSLIRMYVNRLDTVEIVIPYDYESFDFCQLPPKIKLDNRPVMNLGQVVFGERIDSSPYNFTFLKEEECMKVCEKTYDPKIKEQNDKLIFLRKSIMLNYQQHWIIDNMPVTWCYQVEGDQKYCSPGFPVGCYVDEDGSRKDACVIDANFDQRDTYYLFNHINFTVIYHPMSENLEMARIVSIKIEPHSINHKKTGGKCLTTLSENPSSAPMAIPAELKEPISISYTFNVKFVANNELRWASRWDYILDSMPYSSIHCYSIITSLVIVLFLSGMVAIMMLRILHGDIARYSQMDTEETQKEFGWKLVHGDVFRAPRKGMLLSVLLGSGTQIFCTTFITLVFACLGFLSPANRGSLMTCVIVLYVCLGTPAGFVSARMYKTFGGEKWKSNLILTCGLIPSIIFSVFFILNLLLWTKHSSAAIPFSTLIALLAMWFGVSVPLVFVGAYFGFKKRQIEFPVCTNQIPRQIPKQFCIRPLTDIVMGGILPFTCIFTQQFFIMSSIWSHQFYYMFGYLFFVAIILVITCSEATVLLCYLHLRAQDYHWWWCSFLTSGSTAVYVIIYCLRFFCTNLTIRGTASMILYFGYTSIVVLMFFLFTGTVGFFACFVFVRWLYGTLDSEDLETSWADKKKNLLPEPSDKMVIGEGKDEKIGKELTPNQEDENASSKQANTDAGKEGIAEDSTLIREDSPPKETAVGGENEESAEESKDSLSERMLGDSADDAIEEDVSVVGGDRKDLRCPQI